jgi:aerobic-type carbon monoxide dehydrogenase small subunit (CoxS/CutS family)
MSIDRPTQPVSLVVNGQRHEIEVEPRMLLSDVLRHELGLTGTHVGCEQGVCGACTVIVDGKAVRSCLMLAVQADGGDIETVEGVAGDGEMHPVQQAMHEAHGLQCGFCTAGIVMSLVAADRAGVTAADARDEVLGGHLCRCTGYVNIRAAVDAAWAARDDGASTA